MNMQDIERKIRLMREMQRMAEEAQAEADSIKDEIKAYMGASEALSVGEYKITYKTVKGNRLDSAALRQCRKYTPHSASRRKLAVSVWRKEVDNMNEEMKLLLAYMTPNQILYLTALAKELFGDRIEAARERDLGQDKEDIA